MKKMLSLIVCAATVFSVSAAPKNVSFDKLPKSSQEFIQKNFPHEQVKSVEMDRESTWSKYTVYFDSGNRVSFEGGSGDCSQIAMKHGVVPASVVPVKAYTYVGSEYAGRRIVMMKTTSDGFKLKLSDGTLLDFDKSGDFTKAAR